MTSLIEPEGSEPEVETPEVPVVIAETAVVETPPEEKGPVDYERYQEVQREAADRRHALKRFNEAFEGYEPDEVDAFLQIARLAREDDPSVRDQLAEWLGITPAEAEAVTAETPQYLTQADLDRALEERESARAREQAVQSIVSDAQKMGYNHGTPEYILLMHFMNTMTDEDGNPSPDMSRADEMVKQSKQAAVDEFIASKEAEGRQSVHQPTGQGVPASLIEQPAKSFAEARERGESRLDALGRQ